jgi:hypothetical protein
MDRRRLGRMALLASAFALVLVLGRRIPREQTVHYVLGDAAARVESVGARWAQGDGDDWLREATFHFTPGTAPRIVTHEPRLPDGDYTVEIDVRRPTDARTLRRHVTLSGDPVSIDVSSPLALGEGTASEDRPR